MSFEQDIFISYAHIDNRPFGDTRGWIDQLFERLRVRLAQLLGGEPVIWWDGRLQGDMYFAGEIGDRVSRTLLLVPVVTPRYAHSAWCRGELKEFCRRALQTGGMQMRNHSRIFKVVKTPVGEGDEPEELRGLLGYVFFEVDSNGRPREFSPEVTPNKDPKYWARLDDLAWDIKQALEALKAERAETEDESPAAGHEELPLEKKVYLAETTSDLSAERDLVRRELQQRGYYVLPDRELPLTAAALRDAAREHLARAALSVHLVGASYGLIPEGEEERSIIRIQNDLAAERADAEASFTRLVWMPPGLAPSGARQQSFVSELQTNLGANAELLQTSIEDLKLRVVEKLTARETAPAARDAGDDIKRVYLISDNRDAEDVEPIEEYLFRQGYEVLPTITEGDGAELAQYHRESLVNCDAALVYYGRANQMWLRSKLWDLQKAQGWGRRAPLAARAVYVSAPHTGEKERFRTREVPLVIRNFETFSPDALSPFLNAISSGQSL